MIKIFLVEDHEMYLKGLVLLLQQQIDMDVTGTADNGVDFLEKMPLLENEILLLDVNLPDVPAEELIKNIRAMRPNQKVIYLTLMRGTRYVHKLIRYNIQGYVLKNNPLNELLKAIRVVHNGGIYFSNEVNILGAEDFRNTVTWDNNKIKKSLSKREVTILRYVCKEYSNADIASRLFLSVTTIETHRKNLIGKLGVNNTVGLIKFALENNLID